MNVFLPAPTPLLLAETDFLPRFWKKIVMIVNQIHEFRLHLKSVNICEEGSFTSGLFPVVYLVIVNSICFYKISSLQNK